MVGVPELDEKDLAILRVLQQNARASAAEIAARTGIKENTVRFRLRRLLRRGVIRGFVPLLDPRRLGLNISAAFMIKLDAENRESAIGELKSWSEILNMYQFSGEYDIIAVAMLRDLNELQSLIDRIKKVKGVRETNVLVTTRVIKSQPFYIVEQ
jgi:Lrp/AsnC family transcriptional regulator for asnA, asnC and gidA